MSSVLPNGGLNCRRPNVGLLLDTGSTPVSSTINQQNAVSELSDGIFDNVLLFLKEVFAEKNRSAEKNYAIQENSSGKNCSQDS